MLNNYASVSVTHVSSQFHQQSPTYVHRANVKATKSSVTAGTSGLRVFGDTSAIIASNVFDASIGCRPYTRNEQEHGK